MILIIVNPTAGSGKALLSAEEIKRSAASLGIEFTEKKTVCPGDGRMITARLAAKTELPSGIIAVGGDGTVQEIAAGLMDSGLAGKIPFGIIPAGSGNDLFSSIAGQAPPKDITGIASRVLETLKTADSDNIKAIDVIRAEYRNKSGAETDNYCVNVASMGIDAEIVRRAQSLKRVFKSKAYVAATVVTALLYKSGEMTVTVDGVRGEKRGNLLTAVCNGPFYGGGFKISPYASVNDGILSLVRVRPMIKLKVLALFPRVIKGTHTTMKEVTFQDVKKVMFEFDGENRLNLDGNLLPARDRVLFTVIENALRVVV
jgi:diacylglycerol kinase family enzyme